MAENVRGGIQAQGLSMAEAIRGGVHEYTTNEKGEKIEKQEFINPPIVRPGEEVRIQEVREQPIVRKEEIRSGNYPNQIPLEEYQAMEARVGTYPPSKEDIKRHAELKKNQKALAAQHPSGDMWKVTQMQPSGEVVAVDKVSVQRTPYEPYYDYKGHPRPLIGTEWPLDPPEEKNKPIEQVIKDQYQQIGQGIKELAVGGVQKVKEVGGKVVHVGQQGVDKVHAVGHRILTPSEIDEAKVKEFKEVSYRH
jgi:hypothetical protein